MASNQQQVAEQFEALKLHLQQREEACRAHADAGLPYPSELIKLIHGFAEKRYVPARQLFTDLLVRGYPDPEITQALVRALGFHWTDVKSTVPVLARVLGEHYSVDVRLSCASALGSLGTDEAIHPLVRVLCNLEEDEDVKEAAVSSLMENVQVPREDRVKLTKVLAHSCEEMEKIKDVSSLKQLMSQILDSFTNINSSDTLNR